MERRKDRNIDKKQTNVQWLNNSYNIIMDVLKA